MYRRAHLLNDIYLWTSWNCLLVSPVGNTGVWFVKYELPHFDLPVRKRLNINYQSGYILQVSWLITWAGISKLAQKHNFPWIWIHLRWYNKSYTRAATLVLTERPVKPVNGLSKWSVHFVIRRRVNNKEQLTSQPHVQINYKLHFHLKLEKIAYGWLVQFDIYTLRLSFQILKRSILIQTQFRAFV